MDARRGVGLLGARASAVAVAPAMARVRLRRGVRAERPRRRPPDRAVDPVRPARDARRPCDRVQREPRVLRRHDRRRGRVVGVDYRSCPRCSLASPAARRRRRRFVPRVAVGLACRIRHASASSSLSGSSRFVERTWPCSRWASCRRLAGTCSSGPSDHHGSVTDRLSASGAGSRLGSRCGGTGSRRSSIGRSSVMGSAGSDPAQQYFEPAFVRDNVQDDLLQGWFDSHNIVVQIAVGLGIVGLLLRSPSS